MNTTFKSAAIAAALSITMAASSLADDLKIGMVVTLSGPPAALGQQIVDGFQLALDQKNGMLGGQSVELIVEDD